MQIDELKSQRWNMLTNPHAEPVGEMTYFSCQDLSDHIKALKELNRIGTLDSPAGPLSRQEIEQCWSRFFLEFRMQN